MMRANKIALLATGVLGWVRLGDAWAAGTARYSVKHFNPYQNIVDTQKIWEAMRASGWEFELRTQGPTYAARFQHRDPAMGILRFGTAESRHEEEAVSEAAGLARALWESGQ